METIEKVLNAVSGVLGLEDYSRKIDFEKEPAHKKRSKSSAQMKKEVSKRRKKNKRK